MTCLIIPGLNASGPDHWQTRWERRGEGSRVELGCWDDPDRPRWVAAIGRAVARAEGFPILVAHSLGCLAVAWWASVAGEAAAKVTGALLVAPPDVEGPDVDPRLRRFAPVPRRALPFPTIVVGSRDDPYASFGRTSEMAAGWAAALHDMGAAGHINAASGLEDWEEGRGLVTRIAHEASSRWRRPRAATAR